MKKALLLLLTIFASMSISSDAQVVWNLKGGIMPRSVEDGYSENTHRIDWMAGLEIEVPLSSKFNIETGLRFRHHESYDEDWLYGQEEYWDVLSGKIELPVRFAYKQPLGSRFSMHVGAGPYASYAKLEGCNNFGKSLHAGVETSIAFNWKFLSLGATYDIPIYKGYKDMINPAIMATLGFRFNSGAWKYIGAGALAVATVGAGVAMVAGAMKGDNTGSYSTSSSSSSGSSYSSSSSSGSSNSSSSDHTASEVSAKNRDSNTYDQDEGLLIKMNTYWETQYNDNQRREIQQRMKRTRQKWESRGFSMRHSDWEDWDGRKR